MSMNWIAGTMRSRTSPPVVAAALNRFLGPLGY